MPIRTIEFFQASPRPYNIEIGQGDTETIPAVLKEDGVGVDLTGNVITFRMINDLGSLDYDITCTPGATANGSPVPPTAGGITIPFSSKESEASGLFFGAVKTNLFGVISTYPNTGYITIKINKSV